MEFRVLGPLDVRRDGHSIDIRGSRRRAVLALLILHAGEVVRTEKLIEDLWGEDPPANARAALRNHISRLRRDLGEDVLATKPWGYVLRADTDEIDVARFERMASDAKPLAARERSELLAEALSLWRGPALADLAHESAFTAESARLEGLRLGVLEQRIADDLALGRHEDLIPELEALVAEQPLREPLRAQLILALYRAGRQAEALEIYRETRRLLVDELGIEPGAELRELERAILRQDAALTLPRDPDTSPRGNSTGDGRRRRRAPFAVGGIVLLGVAGGVAALLLRPEGTAHAHQAQPSTSNTQATATVGSPLPQPQHKPPPPPTHRSAAHARAKAVSHLPHRAVVRHAIQRSTSPRAQRHAPSTKTASGASSSRLQPRPVQRFLIKDDFADPAFDFATWHRATDGAGWDFVERNGQLEIGLAADAVLDGKWDVVEGHYGTQCRLTGDFDARVDYELLAWPDASGATVYLGAYLNTKEGTPYVSRGSAKEGDSYAFGFPSWRLGNAVPTGDAAGSLRLVRHQSLITGYYKHGGKWVSLSSGAASNPATIVLQLAASSSFSHQAVRVALDNFSVESDGVRCPPGIPTPPHKP